MDAASIDAECRSCLRLLLLLLDFFFSMVMLSPVDGVDGVDGADESGSDSDASGFPKNGYDMAIDESDDKLDDGVVGVVEKTDPPEVPSAAAAAAAAAAVAARRRFLLDPLFRLGGVNLAESAGSLPDAGRRSLLCDAEEEDACDDVVDVDGIGPLLSESRTTGFAELLRELFTDLE